MGETKLSFRRYEKKYLLSEALYSSLWERLKGYVTPDEYHRSTVCSLYYDRDDYHLIRQSIERPLYKEKLRLRSYNVPGPEDMVFVELKKKFRGVVYKRRVSMAAEQAGEYLAGRALPAEDSQIVREINWFLRQNLPEPKVFIACDRTAYCGLADPELRITFDRNIRWRDTELNLCSGSQGKSLLEPGTLLMEAKISGAAPLWLAHMLSELEIFPTSFSKYGECYRENILEKYVNGVIFSA